MAKIIDKLKGFRDFFPDDCAVRNYVFDHWRGVARRYGFVEYEGPILEPTDLYKKKSGDEISGQLFCFEDKGGRDVSMRPELTPTLARMAAKRQRDFKKPMKWFGIGRFLPLREEPEGPAARVLPVQLRPARRRFTSRRCGTGRARDRPDARARFQRR